jgi:hypothetical protein
MSILDEDGISSLWEVIDEFLTRFKVYQIQFKRARFGASYCKTRDGTKELLSHGTM